MVASGFVLAGTICSFPTVSADYGKTEPGQIDTKICNTLIVADSHYTSDGNPGRDEHYTDSGSGIMPDAEHYVAAPDGYIAGKGDFRRVHAF
jgi:hypothetical protein